MTGKKAKKPKTARRDKEIFAKVKISRDKGLTITLPGRTFKLLLDLIINKEEKNGQGGEESLND